MTNAEKYKTAEERTDAFARWMHENCFKNDSLHGCTLCKLYTLAKNSGRALNGCCYRWLELEAEGVE